MKINLKQHAKELKPAIQAAKLLTQKKFEAFLVGGAVRNLILGKPSDNFDIATNATPDEVESILKANNIPSKTFGKKFGTLLTTINGVVIEITTYRSEGRYTDRRHPDQVQFISDYKQDALRRDFTINALYLNCLNGEVLDPTGGLADLKRGLIKFVGRPQHRIDEDALRMMRAVRFSAQLGFKLERNTYAAIKTRSKYIQDVTGERIKAELDKILISENRDQGIRLLDELGILRFLIPGSEKTKLLKHDSKMYHLEGNVFEHTLLAVNATTTLHGAYAMLFHDMGKISTRIKQKNTYGEMVSRYFGHQQKSSEMFQTFAKRLKFPKKQSALINWLIVHHDDRPGFRTAKLGKQIKYASHNNFRELLEVWHADSLANHRVLEDGTVGTRPSEASVIGETLLKKLVTLRPLISELTRGEKIISITQIHPGPKIKFIQEKVREAIFENKIKNISDLNNFLKKYSKKHLTAKQI